MIKVKIKHQALYKGVKLSTVSRDTGIHRNNLYPLANNEHQNISFKHLEKLCKYFECKPSDLLEVTED